MLPNQTEALPRTAKPTWQKDLKMLGGEDLQKTVSDGSDFSVLTKLFPTHGFVFPQNVGAEFVVFLGNRCIS